MYVSKYNLNIEIDGDHILLNSLSGAMDFVDRDTIQLLKDLKNGKEKPDKETKVLFERGYIYNSKIEEDDKVNKKFEEWDDVLSKKPCHFFINASVASTRV